MRPVFLILPLALGVSACAQQAVIAHTSPCEHSAPANGAGTAHFFESNGLVLLGRNLVGTGRLDPQGVSASACSHIEDNNTNAPRSYDLHKVGQEPVPSVIRSAWL